MSGATDADERLDHPSTPGEPRTPSPPPVLTRARGRRHDDEAQLLAERPTGSPSSALASEHACTLCLVPSRTAEGESELAALGCAPPAAVG